MESWCITVMALACTWPAYAPERWKETDDAAWYGNTASFIVDRFKEGKPSASGANCEYVLVLVLDDVGEKAKIPNLEPSWKMQTSPKSQQWGYKFHLDHQPTKADYAAAILAIAQAGYTDKGAINPVRNFRLPGSVNLKPDKMGFRSQLLEWHPERDFTLPQICEALGVTPAEASTSQHRSVQLMDDGKDEVVAWLVKQGMVLDRPNSSGWMGVVCPNAEEHTNGDPMGRYHPVHRSYSCMHGHCQDWNTRRYLTWVAEQGGPTVESGLRPELVSDAIARVMEKLNAERAAKGSTFSKDSDAEGALKRIAERDAGKLAMKDWFKTFAYIRQEDSYFNLVERKVWSRRAFDATYRHIDCRSKHGKHPKVQASVKFDEEREAMGALVIEQLTYSPGDGELVERNGQAFGNRWMNQRPAGVAGNVSLWLDLWKRLIPDDMERNHILDVLAFKVQHPKIKINHALLIAGGHGIGKDTALAPFFWAIGGSQHGNVSVVRNDEVGSKWGYSLESEVILYNELRQAEAKDRRALENQLKPIIAAPPEMLTVECKGMHPYQVVNRLLVIAYSNERAAIAIPSEDRRWFVTWSDCGQMTREQGALYWDWYAAGGFEAIAAYLQTRNVAAFSPTAPPPMTEAKRIMISDARSGPEEYLIHMIESRQSVFASGAIGSPFHGVLDVLQQGYPGGKLYMGALTHALREAGWVDKGRLKSATHRSNKRVFCAPELKSQPASALRDLVEQPAAAVSPLSVVR